MRVAFYAGVVFSGAGWHGEAKAIITRDEDLLALEIPFGIEIITPRGLLARLAKQFVMVNPQSWSRLGLLRVTNGVSMGASG